MKEVKAIVSGKVTGVMFRDFVQRKARALWIVGTVQNKERSVHVVAQGSEEKLKQFVAHLHKGPFMAQVRGVSVSWCEPEKKHEDFVIVY